MLSAISLNGKPQCKGDWCLLLHSLIEAQGTKAPHLSSKPKLPDCGCCTYFNKKQNAKITPHSAACPLQCFVMFYLRTKSHFFFSSLKAIPAIAMTIGVATSIIFLILWDLLEAQEGQKSISSF